MPRLQLQQFCNSDLKDASKNTAPNLSPCLLAKLAHVLKYSCTLSHPHHGIRVRSQWEESLFLDILPNVSLFSFE